MASLKENEEMEKNEEIESDNETIPGEESDEELDEELDEEDDIKKVESEEEANEAEEDEEASEAEEEEGENITKKRASKNKRAVVVNTIGSIDMLKASKKAQAVNYDEDSDEEDDEDDDEEDVNYLQKFDSKMRDNFILNHHPEARMHNYEEVKALTRVSRDGRGIIIDPLHRTIPILTKYEMTRVIGQRAKQLDSGAKAFVKVPLNVVDGYLIALLELEQKKLPFIIKRPFPNGGVEYWNVNDLEVLL